MTIVVCTAWLGAADTLAPPRVRNPDVRYVCLVDHGRPAPGWDRHMVTTSPYPRWLARWAKCHASWLPAADVTIWMDASFELLVDPVEIASAASETGAPLVGFVHPHRARISEEADAIIRFGLAPATTVRRQLAAYQAAGFDAATQPQRVLTTTGLLVRTSSPAVAALQADWWEEQQQHTLRDQLSLDFCAWRRGVPIGYLPGHYLDNRFVHYDAAAHRQGRVAS